MRRLAAVCIITICTFLLLESATWAAVESGWTHSRFAVWLVRKAGAEYLLPPAATTKDYFDFLKKNGIEPQGGWKADSLITLQEMELMLGLRPGSGVTLEQLMEMMGRFLREILSGARPLPSVSSAIP